MYSINIFKISLNVITFWIGYTKYEGNPKVTGMILYIYIFIFMMINSYQGEKQTCP